MKIISKQIFPRVENMPIKNISTYQKSLRHKGFSKSLSKPIKTADSLTTLKKEKDKKSFQIRELKVIREAP
jgi:hypothetical protein